LNLKSPRFLNYFGGFSVFYSSLLLISVKCKNNIKYLYSPPTIYDLFTFTALQ
jgi:hypothetical protein